MLATLATRRLSFCALAVLLALAVSLASSAGSTAADQAGPTLSIAQLIKTDDEHLTAIISVLGANARPVIGLTDFQASVDGEPATVTAARPVIDSTTGIAVVLLIDVSGSMVGSPLEQARLSASAFVDSLSPKDVALVIPFSDIVQTGQAFSSDKAALKASIGQLTAGGNTALYDAVAAGVDAALGAAESRRTIVLLSDGTDDGNVSTQSREASLSRVEGSGLPVFAIGLGAKIDYGYLTALAELSGGSFQQALGPADIPGVYASISELLLSQYEVQVTAPPPGAGGERTLRVSTVVGGATLAGEATFEVSAPPPPPPAPTTEPAAQPKALPETDGGAPVWTIAAIALALALATGGAAAAVRWRRALRPKNALATAAATGGSLNLPGRVAPEREAGPSAALVVVAGPQSGQRLTLGVEPVTIGTDPGCALQLQAADGAVGARHARVWLREGRFMIHHLARGKLTMIQGRPVEWAVLEPGDEIVVGPHRLSFELVEGGR